MTPARAALLALSLAALAACAKPPPDVDGDAPGAVALPLGQAHDDTLACKRGDCADWYRVAVPREGQLEVDVEAAGGAKGPHGAFAARLVDAGGATLARGEGSGADARVRLHSSVTEGAVLVDVAPADPDAEVAYAITARFKPAPPPAPAPPQPRFEMRSAAVLEVEGERSARPAVLLDAGEGAKLAPGMRGRLVDHGKTIGAIVVQEVYPDGSRARVEGPLSGQITPHTTAEIEVPVGPEAGAERPPER